MQNKTVQVTFRDGLLLKLKNTSLVSYGIVGDFTNQKTGLTEKTHIPFDSMKSFVELD